jgi:hypothetical protein
MKTIIHKDRRHGFILSEADLRRIGQTIIEAAQKIESGENIEHKLRIHVSLEDGTILELASVDDVIQLDNSGQHQIEYLSMAAGAKPDEEGEGKWWVRVSFEKVQEYYSSRRPILFQVRSDSRDWAVLTITELALRIDKVRRINFGRILANPVLPVLVLAMGVLLFLGVAGFASGATTSFSEVESLYATGKLTNPIEAMILLEKIRIESGRFTLQMLFVLVCVLGVLSLGVPAMGRLITTPCVFYIGEEIETHNKRRRIHSIVWVTCILAVATGVLSSYISNSLGF